MSISARTIFFILSLMPLLALASDSKWDFAGEIQGVAFHLRIKDACKDGSKVTIRLKGSFEEDMIVNFRLNDSDWRKSFVREMKSGKQEAILTFAPEDGQACHPYVDEVYVETKADVAANSGDPEGFPGN